MLGSVLIIASAFVLAGVICYGWLALMRLFRKKPKRKDMKVPME